MAGWGQRAFWNTTEVNREREQKGAKLKFPQVDHGKKMQAPLFTTTRSYSSLPPTGAQSWNYHHQILNTSGHWLPLEWRANTPPPPPKRYSPISAGHSALWGSASLRRGWFWSEDKRGKTDHLSSHTPSAGQTKQRQPSSGSHYPSQRDFPISRCRLASRPRPHDKEKALGELGLPASTDGGGGCRGEEPPPHTRAYTLGSENGGPRGPSSGEAWSGRGGSTLK